MNWIGYAYLIGLTIITVFGDILLKQATKFTGNKAIIYFIGGALVYLLVAFGFYQMYKYLEFSTSGMIYAIVTILLFAISGVLIFGEKITIYEGIGIILAIISVFLMARFAN